VATILKIFLRINRSSFMQNLEACKFNYKFNLTVTEPIRKAAVIPTGAIPTNAIGYIPAIVCRLSLWKITRACWLVFFHAKWVPKRFHLNLNHPSSTWPFSVLTAYPFFPILQSQMRLFFLTYQRFVKCRTCIEIISEHTVAFVQQACHQINNNFRGTRQIRHSINSFSSVNWKMPEVTSNAIAQFMSLFQT